MNYSSTYIFMYMNTSNKILILMNNIEKKIKTKLEIEILWIIK